MFSAMMGGSSSGGNRRATSLGKGHLSQAAVARLARTSSWNDGLDNAGSHGASSVAPLHAQQQQQQQPQHRPLQQQHSILRVCNKRAKICIEPCFLYTR